MVRSRREDTKMAATNKLWIIQRQDGAHCVDEFWVIHNLDTIVLHVEQLHTTEVIENLIRIIVNNVVSNDGWQTSGLNNQLQTAFKDDEVFLGNKRGEVGHVATKNLLVQAIGNLLGDVIASLADLSAIGLAPDGFNVDVVHLARHDDE